MSRLQEIRRSYPQYNDLSDEQLLTGLHQRFYSDMPFGDFMSRIGQAPAQPQVTPGSGSSLLSGAYGLGGNLASAAEGVGRITGIERLERLGREGRIRAEQAAEEALPESERMSFGQAEGIRQNIRAAGQAIGSSLPSAVPGLAGTLGGAAIGSAILPGPGSIIGGVVGGAAATIPQFFGANRQRQIQETGEVQSEGRALAAALPQAVSEGVVDRLTLGLGRVLGVGGETVAREVLPRIATGIGVGAVSNVPAEVFQQAIERAQAGLDVLGPEAMSEYREAATAAAVVGGTMGGTIAGAFGPRPAPPPGDDRPELQRAIQDIVAAREPEPTLAIGSDPVIETPVGDMRRTQFLRYMERRLPEMAADNPQIASLLEYTRNQPEEERIQIFRDLLDQEQQRLVDARQRSEAALIASAPPEFQAVPIEDLPTKADGGPLSKTEFEALRVRERATKPVTLEDLEARDLAEARGTPEGQSVEQLIKDFKRNKAKPAGQKSLTQFIVEQGGIRDEGSEVRNMLGNNLRSRPGLINNKGLPLDLMAEAAREAGYFDDMQRAGLFVDEGRAWRAGEDIDPLDARAFMNALEEDFSGRNRRFGRTEDIAGREKQAALADLDEYLRAQGTDIDAPLPDILRTLRRQNPDAPSLSLDELIEADKAYAWYQDAVAAKRAKRGRRPTAPTEAPVETPVAAAKEVQPGQPPSTPQGSFSARVPAGAAQTQAKTQAEQPTEQAAPNQDKARQFVKEYLSELKAEGRQGRLIAKDLEALLNDRQFDANQIYQAFIVAKTLTKTMPGNADYRLKFLSDLVISKRQAEAAKASGAKAGDRAQAYVNYPTESLPGFIEISLAPDMLPYLRETAAHEAFHVLQTYFGQYDKTFADRINKFFRNDMTIADLEPSIKRRLMSLKPPGSKQSYYDSLVEGLGDAKLSASEAQAYAFGSLIDAMNRGQKVTALIPSFQRFTNFARNFFNTMKRALTGDGFTSPADILTQAQQRGRAMEQAAPVGVGQQFSSKKVTDRDPILEEAARGVRDGSVSRAQYEQLVNERKPVTPYTEVPQPATRSEIIRALELTDPRKVPKIGVPSKTLKRGDLVGLRLDIPAYSKQNTWVVSVHEAKGQSFYAGTAIGYEPVAMAKNVQLGVVPGAAMKIAAGDIDKSTIAVMRGEWEPTTPENAKAQADAALNDPAWVQVGMDPRRHQYFYDRASKEPVIAADEVIQIGPLVLAKNPTYASKSNYQFSARRVSGVVAGLPQFGQRVPAATPQSINQADLVVQYDVASRYLSKKLGRFIEPPKVERFFMSFQDKMLPVGRMIDDVRKAGGNVPVAMDTYLKEDLLQGKIATMLEDRNKALYSKLTESLSKSGISLEDFENYLYARHAPERNAYIASINPDMPDGGSGLTNEQADDFMREFRQQGKLPRMQELARLFDQIIADTNKLRVDSGLNPDFSTMKVTSDGNPVPNYENYVPLRGFAEESPDGDETITEFRTGRALGAKGREDKKALGRERKAGDLLAHTIMQNTQAVIRSETNKVGQSFLDMIRANPDQTSSLAEVISSTPMRRALVNDTVKMVPDLTYKNQPDVLVVKEGGNEVAIRIKDENVARALTGASALSPNSKNLLIQGMALVNRYLAKINTAWNPEFLITNFTRDLQTFGVNVQQFDLEGITRDSLRDLKGAMSGVHDSVRGSNNNPVMRRAYERFKQLGGTTELYGFSDLDSRISEINQVMSGIGNQAKSWKDMAKVVTPVIKFIEDYNTVVENGIRTSLFKNLVDRGIDEERAAQIAKNVTVNFSKGGENRVLMNSLYLFYNAALQGSMAMVNAIGRSAKVRKIVGGIVVAGVLQDAINSMLSDVGDDDEAIYDKVPDHILKRSFVMMDPFGLTERGYFSFPMPYGFNAFYNMGREMSKAARGKADPMKAAGNIVGTFVDAFNPIGGTESFLNFVAPTILDPVVDISTNTDFTGRPIVPERGGFGVQPPESQKYWNNTFAPYVDIASFLNELTGGTPVIPGKVDISPALIQYVVNYVTGGVGKFVERSYTTTTSTIPGLLRGDLEDIDVKGVPFLRSLYGNVTSREDMSVYTERMNEVLQVRQEIRQAAQAGMPERVQAAMERYPGQVQIMDAFNSLSRDRMQISRQINEINRNANIPDDAKKDIIKSLRDQQNMLVQMANRLYIQNVERR